MKYNWWQNNNEIEWFTVLEIGKLGKMPIFMCIEVYTFKELFTVIIRHEQCEIFKNKDCTSLEAVENMLDIVVPQLLEDFHSHIDCTLTNLENKSDIYHPVF
jgi:hypothetical protein